MESKNVRHTVVKKAERKMVDLLDSLRHKKQKDLDELSSKMSFYFPAE